MGETNEETRVKVSAAVALGMYPILCVGETARTHEGDYFAFIKEELRAGFAEVAVAKVSRVTVAYEPIWAIGAATAMDPRDMHEMAIFIRKSLVELYGEKAMAVRILYGGAIGAENAVAMLTHGDIAGLLVGRASADPVKLTELARSIKQL